MSLEANISEKGYLLKQLLYSPRVREVSQFADISRPFASDMKLLKHSVTKEYKQNVPIKLYSLWLSLIMWFRQFYICFSSLFIINFNYQKGFSKCSQSK